MYIRLQKALSEYGIMSRRAAESLIDQGRIKVNGKAALPGVKIDPETDTVEIDGKSVELSKGKYVYIMLNKPRGYITSLSDERGRKTVLDLLEGVSERVYPVGRLDYASEGLLLLTNDGDFANKLMHPSFGKSKTYIVTVKGNAAGKEKQLSEPMKIDGYMISKPEAELLRAGENKTVFKITIHEGRNRQIRKMCAHLGLTVLKLKRTEIGPLSLGDLGTGRWRYLTEDEVHSLLKDI